MDTGWIKLYRKLLDDVIWIKSTNEQRVILVALLLMANHEAREWEWGGKKFKVLPGQFVTSIDGIMQVCSGTVTTQNIRTALAKFEKLGFLTNQSTKTGRLITIVNWSVYQCDSKVTNKDTGKDLTKSSQRGNKDLTPNKNDKNVKNDNKNIYIHIPNVEKVQLTQEQYDKLVADYGKDYIDNKILDLDNYIVNGKGSRYKDHNKVLRSWIRNDKKQNKKEEEYDPLYFK